MYPIGQMIDNGIKIRSSVKEFLDNHPVEAHRHKTNLDTNLGALFLDFVETPQEITAGELYLPKVSGFGSDNRGHNRLLIATYLNDKTRNRQLWVPYMSREEGKSFVAEIAATDEETMLDGWYAAQTVLQIQGDFDQYDPLFKEGIGFLKNIGAMAMGPTDRIQDISLNESI